MIRRTLRHAALATSVSVDRAFVRLAFRNSLIGRRAARDSVADRLQQATALYPSLDGELFAAPPIPRPRERAVRGLDGGEVVDLAWPSDYRAIHEAHQQTMERCPENAVCRARWFRHAAVAPAIVLLHGWGAGQFDVEERIYSVDWLYSRVGLDVVLHTLPFHGQRRPHGRRTPMFPSPDPVRSTEGFAQAIGDLRGLIRMLHQRGAPAVGVSGMSLGGFTTSLLATVADDLDFAVPVIPFASLPELLWGHGQGTRARRRAEKSGLDLAQFRAAFGAIAPLDRPPTIDPTRVLIVAGERDQVTPIAHARRLHQHFAGARFATFPGGHLVQIGRRAIFREMARFLRAIGVV